MIGKILNRILGIFQGPGATVGNAVAHTASTVAVIAALTPAVIWLVANKDEPFVTLSYGESVLVFALLFVILKIVHYTRPTRLDSQ